MKINVFPNDGISRKLFLSNTEIQEKIKELAVRITADYQDKNPIFIGILKGSILFFADLVRQIGKGVYPEFDFIEVSTYVGTNHKGSTNIEKELSSDIKGRDVLIIEDIVDKGISLSSTLKILRERNPNSIKVCVLLSKTEAREVEVPIDYLGFEVPNKWIEGYGLDTDEKFRNLKDIWYRI